MCISFLAALTSWQQSHSHYGCIWPELVGVHSKKVVLVNSWCDLWRTVSSFWLIVKWMIGIEQSDTGLFQMWGRITIKTENESEWFKSVLPLKDVMPFPQYEFKYCCRHECYHCLDGILSVWTNFKDTDLTPFWLWTDILFNIFPFLKQAQKTDQSLVMFLFFFCT